MAAESICDLDLGDVKQYDPSEFVRCRVFYQGTAFDGESKSWYISPDQAVILSDVSHNDGKGLTRLLTGAESVIMQSCPDELWARPSKPTEVAFVNKIGLYSTYDLIR